MNDRFRQQVFDVISLIPEGRVTTYGAIAKAIGFPKHARHVGNALTDYDVDFPAHRVCGAGGKITASTCLQRFTEKLQREGVEVKEGKIKNFTVVFWDPLEEL